MKLNTEEIINLMNKKHFIIDNLNTAIELMNGVFDLSVSNQTYKLNIEETFRELFDAALEDVIVAYKERIKRINSELVMLLQKEVREEDND